MSQVVGLDGKAVADDPVVREREMAIVELRKLLVEMEEGRVPVTRWVLIYAQDLGGNDESNQLLDSGMSLSTCLWVIEAGKRLLFDAARGGQK